MKQYEITYLMREENPKSSPVAKEIEGLEGKVVSESHLGQKTLAFPIKKEKNAYFAVANFEIEPESLSELNRKLQLKDEILRHLIVIASKVKPVVRQKKSKIAADAVEIKEIEPPPEKTEIKEPVKKPVIKKPVSKKEAPKETESEAERLKALDAKLDELLKE